MILGVAAIAAAENPEYYDVYMQGILNPALYSVCSTDHYLRMIDTGGTTLVKIPIRLNGEPVYGAAGLATHPNTLEVYAVLDVGGYHVVATIDQTSGQAEEKFVPNEKLAGLAFAPYYTMPSTLYSYDLYAINEDGTRLYAYEINGNAFDEFAVRDVSAPGQTSGGSNSIAFNPYDELLYHGGYSSTFYTCRIQALEVGHGSREFSQGITCGEEVADAGASAMTYWPAWNGVNGAHTDTLLWASTVSSVLYSFDPQHGKGCFPDAPSRFCNSDEDCYITSKSCRQFAKGCSSDADCVVPCGWVDCQFSPSDNCGNHRCGYEIWDIGPCEIFGPDLWYNSCQVLPQYRGHRASVGVLDHASNGLAFAEAVDVPPEDLNGDGCVDRTDLTIAISHIRGSGPHNPDYDFNNDGAVNIADARYLVIRLTNPRGCHVSKWLFYRINR